MKTILTFITFLVFTVTISAASWDQGKEWLEISKEYKEEILDKLKESKEFTKDQLEVINGCLDESSVKNALNCFSDGGIDGAAGALTIIRDELAAIGDRICGGNQFGNKDQCQKFGDSLNKLKNDLQEKWIAAVERGKKYLEQQNKLLFMKRKICKKIDQEGCYNWLNERIELNCKPEKLGNDPAAIEKCQIAVTEEVWSRLN